MTRRRCLKTTAFHGKALQKWAPATGASFLFAQQPEQACGVEADSALEILWVLLAGAQRIRFPIPSLPELRFGLGSPWWYDHLIFVAWTKVGSEAGSQLKRGIPYVARKPATTHCNFHWLKNMYISCVLPAGFEGSLSLQGMWLLLFSRGASASGGFTYLLFACKGR